MKLASETIYSSKTELIPMCDVAFIQKEGRPEYAGAITIVFKYSKWQDEFQQWSPNVYLLPESAKEFVAAYCHFRSEVDPVQQSPTPTQSGDEQ